jgi:hypothetical protein
MPESTAVTISFVLIHTLEVGRTLLSPGKRILFIAESPFGGKRKQSYVDTDNIQNCFIVTRYVVVVNIDHELYFF